MYTSSVADPADIQFSQMSSDLVHCAKSNPKKTLGYKFYYDFNK